MSWPKKTPFPNGTLFFDMFSSWGIPVTISLVQGAQWHQGKEASPKDCILGAFRYATLRLFWEKLKQQWWMGMWHELTQWWIDLIFLGEIMGVCLKIRYFLGFLQCFPATNAGNCHLQINYQHRRYTTSGKSHTSPLQIRNGNPMVGFS